MGTLPGCPAQPACRASPRCAEGAGRRFRIADAEAWRAAARHVGLADDLVARPRRVARAPQVDELGAQLGDATNACVNVSPPAASFAMFSAKKLNFDLFGR